MINIKKILITLIIFTLFLSSIYFAFFWKKDVNIKFINNTNSIISNLKIKSKELKNDLIIPPIKPNEKYKIKFNSSEEFTKGEASIELEHTNEQNQKEFFTIIGYIEKGSGENINIIFKSYENGKLIITENGEEVTGISEKEIYKNK